MGWIALAQQFGFEFLQTLASGGELFSRRRERIFQKVANRIIFTQHHRELWGRYVADPELHRVKRHSVDLTLTPLLLKEHQFVTDLIHHLAACFDASEKGVFEMPTAIATDIKVFFALPIPRTVWEINKAFHNRKFVAFVERHAEIVMQK